MPSIRRFLLFGALYVQRLTAAPTPEPGVVGDLVSGLLDTVDDTLGTVKNATTVLASLLAAKPDQAALKSSDELRDRLSSIWADEKKKDGDFYDRVHDQIKANILPVSLVTALADLVGPPIGIDLVDNVNLRKPSPAIYPRKASGDAPYSVTEAKLRAAIQIPAGFTYGKKPPTILVPGTGVYGGETYANNLYKLLKGQSYADPVWLNIPGALNGDAQVNAEYVAYAINYISGISGSGNSEKVSVISWSQGGLITQWALQFWPSTRKVVSGFIPISPDFHGTVLAKALCASSGNGEPGLDPCDPAVIQQEYNSEFVAALRGKGGADAYVPTTTVYSGFFDEIVEPQQGKGASAYLNDARGVGVTNVEVQSACKGGLAGTFYGHAELLFNPLTAALVKDALTHDGPGKLSRIQLKDVCGDYIAPGLTLADATATAAEIVAAAIRILAFFPKYTAEPDLMVYAS